MIEAIGIDIADVGRMERVVKRWGTSFLEKIFTESEIAFCESRHHKYPSYAARFACKEAVAKCLGTGFRRGVYPRLIEIVDNERSRPTVKLHGNAAEFGKDRTIHLSLSHEKNVVAAVAVMEA
ncbi:MAG: holo-ACP synthase [Candidatus Edwardsbacteria bacterium]|nr:holo-ACP synthase [Candidatus Edwardsbacteria bacterium]